MSAVKIRTRASKGRLACTLAAAVSLSFASSLAFPVQDAHASDLDDRIKVMEEHVDWDEIGKAADDGEDAGKVRISISQNETDESGNPTGEFSANGNECILIPGKEYEFAPIIEVDPGSAPFELFMAFENELVELIDQSSLRAQMESNGWVLVDEEKDVYKYSKVVETSDELGEIATFSNIRFRDDAELEVGEVVKCSYFAHAIGMESTSTAYVGLPQTGDSHWVWILAFAAVCVLSIIVLRKASDRGEGRR